MLKTPKKVHCKNCHSCDSPCGALIAISSRELKALLKECEQSLVDIQKRIESEDKDVNISEEECNYSYISGQISIIKGVLNTSKEKK
jgi:hypothetical protein